MDFLRLAHPWVPAILLPVWALVLWATLRPKGRRQGAPARALLTCLATGLLLMALAAPSIRLSRAGAPAVCILQDESPSMGIAGAMLSTGQIDALTERVPGLERNRIRFGADDGETDLAAALRQGALGLPDGRGVVLLYTDARETRGDAARAASRLAARGIRVHALLPGLQPVDDVRVAAIESPPHVEAGRPVTIRVRLAATRPMDVAVRLARAPSDGAPASRWEKKTHVEADLGAAILFQDTPPAQGYFTYAAEVVSERDRVSQNNRASCLVQVGEPRRILYVYAGEAPGGTLTFLRRRPALQARLKALAVIENPAPAAAEASVLILDNVSAWALGRQAAGNLAQRVTDGGLGLLVLGGDAAFAAGGYADSPLEEVLPVSSRTGRRPPLEMVLLVDASGSMNEKVGDAAAGRPSGGTTKLTLAKQAVLALRAALTAADRVGVVAFAGEPRTVSPLIPLARWETLRARLLALEAGGGTRITPAVESGLGLFSAAAAPEIVRHMLILSDGQSRDFDVPRLEARCRERGVSVSAVATGAEADVEPLRRLAHATGGRLYVTGALGQLTETFLKDLTWARGEGLREGPRTTRWRDPEPLWRQPGPPLPEVGAYNVTRPKQGAAVHWVAPAEEEGGGDAPLLATWRRGLGKVAAMPWPVARAGAGRIEDASVARYLEDILTWLDGPRTPAQWSARLIERDGRWRLRVEERADSITASPVRFSAAVFTGSGEVQRVPLEPVGPGFYEANLGPRIAEAASVVVHSPALGEATRLSAPGLPPREYDHFGVDRRRLERIVQAGGGEIHETTESFVRAMARLEASGRTSIAVHLLWCAAGVVVLLVIGRLTGRL